MADIDELAFDDEFEDEEQPAKSSSMMSVIVALIGLAGGGAVGLTTLGPTVGPILAERSSAPASDDGHGGGDDGYGGEAQGPSALHLIDNVVVNPARSGGTRFLLTSVAVEVQDPSYTESVADRDVEIRAALLVLLGTKTVDELTDIASRASIVTEIEHALVQILGPGVVRRIFIPQFVIQ